MPDKQPGPREELFLFVGEEPLIDEDFAADDAALGIDQTDRLGSSAVPWALRCLVRA